MKTAEETRRRGKEENEIARTRVKICGLTRYEDALEAIRLGADALGFIFVPESPRYVLKDPTLFSQLRKRSPFVSCVGVARNLEQLLAAQREGDVLSQITALQVYEDYACPADLTAPTHFIRAFRVKDESVYEEIESSLLSVSPEPSALLLDAYHKDKLGGSGETFDWEIAVEVKRRFGLPIILAGGLTPDNVAEAIRRVRPYAVDVSSGVEAEPGRKDFAKLAAFFVAVKKADSLDKKFISDG